LPRNYRHDDEKKVVGCVLPADGREKTRDSLFTPEKSKMEERGS